VTAKHMVGALDEQGAQIDVPGLGDAELGVSSARLTSSWSQSQVATHVPASLEPLFATQSENTRQRRELAYAIYLDECMGLGILCLG
jgi:hypothetical protein